MGMTRFRHAISNLITAVWKTVDRIYTREQTQFLSNGRFVISNYQANIP